MCKKHNIQNIDKCMKPLIILLNTLGLKTIACCCGHNRYPMSVVIQVSDGSIIEILSMKTIPRTKRFYKKDKEGYYYIPETIKKR